MKSHLITKIQNNLNELETLCAYPEKDSDCRKRLSELFYLIHSTKNDFERLIEELF